jgi:hypothetical protein
MVRFQCSPASNLKTLIFKIDIPYYLTYVYRVHKTDNIYLQRTSYCTNKRLDAVRKVQVDSSNCREFEPEIIRSQSPENAKYEEVLMKITPNVLMYYVLYIQYIILHHCCVSKNEKDGASVGYEYKEIACYLYQTVICYCATFWNVDLISFYVYYLLYVLNISFPFYRFCQRLLYTVCCLSVFAFTRSRSMWINNINL